MKRQLGKNLNLVKVLYGLKETKQSVYYPSGMSQKKECTRPWRIFTIFWPRQGTDAFPEDPGARILRERNEDRLLFFHGVWE